MDIENTTDVAQMALKPAKKIQVNTDLFDEVADAFERYRDTTGVRLNAPALRMLIVPRLQELGYLRSDIATELQPVN